MKFTAFSIPSKPSSSITRPSIFCDEGAEEAEEGLQYVTEFDGAASTVEQPKSIIIPRQENTWRPDRKMKNTNLASVDLQFDTRVEEDLKTDSGYGLNLRNRVNKGEQQEEMTSFATKSIMERLWDQKYKEDVVNLPDEDGPESIRMSQLRALHWPYSLAMDGQKARGLGEM